MVRFHWFVAAPLARQYTHWALSNLRSECAVELDVSEALSDTEETRLMRSLYRFQLCCTLFGKSRLGIPPVIGDKFESVEILVLFLSLFEPWEVEELACIYAFAKEKYEQVFRDIKWDVDEMNPKFDGQRPPTPDGAFDFDDRCKWLADVLLHKIGVLIRRFAFGNQGAYTMLLQGTISRGLDLLRAVFDIGGHDLLVSTMQSQITWVAGDLIEGDAMERGRPNLFEDEGGRQGGTRNSSGKTRCPLRVTASRVHRWAGQQSGRTHTATSLGFTCRMQPACWATCSGTRSASTPWELEMCLSGSARRIGMVTTQETT